MSNRDSLGRGDLIPQDVVDILAQEKHNRRSLKKRSNSLGRALGWLKGRKRQSVGVKGQKLAGAPEIFMPVDALPAGHHGGGHRGGQRSGRQAPQGHGKRLQEPLWLFREGAQRQKCDNVSVCLDSCSVMKHLI